MNVHESLSSVVATGRRRRHAVGLTLLIASTAVFALAGWFAALRLMRPSKGKLQAIQSTAVWKSPPIRNGAPHFKAKAEFSLINRGGAVVHITSVESACGCTIPSVAPTSVQPGATAVVTTIGTPLASGERTVAITIRTDSPLSPEIRLYFKMITDRVAPFITQVAGDFTYPADFSTGESRDLVVTTIESGPQSSTPIVQTDLPFLKVSKPTIREARYDESSVMQRTYTYRITFHAAPADGCFTGRIWAIDPWTGAKTDEVLAFHRAQRSIVAVPSAVTLNTGGDSMTHDVQLVLLTKHVMPRLVVEPASASSQAIETSEISANRAARMRKFLIRGKSTGINGVEKHSLIVRESPEAQEYITIPVTFMSPSP